MKPPPLARHSPAGCRTTSSDWRSGSHMERESGLSVGGNLHGAPPLNPPSNHPLALINSVSVRGVLRRSAFYFSYLGA